MKKFKQYSLNPNNVISVTDKENEFAILNIISVLDQNSYNQMKQLPLQFTITLCPEGGPI